MAKYYYDKYNLAESYWYTNMRRGAEFESTGQIRAGTLVGSGYRLDNYFGIRTTNEEPIENFGVGGLCYIGMGKAIKQVYIMSKQNDTVFNVRYYNDHMIADMTTYYSKGSFVETIIEEEGVYPDNGKSGFHWYIKRELANSTPSITDSTINNKNLFEKDTLILSGSVTDSDIGDMVTIKYSINDKDSRNLKIFTSDGKSNSYSKTLTYTNGTIKDGATIVDSELKSATTYNIKIWAEDDKGNKSSVVTRSFTITTNRPPVIDGTDSDLGNKNSSFNINYKVTDLDGDKVNVTEKLNGTILKTINNAPQGIDTTLTITNEQLYNLPLNETNIIEIRVEDEKGSVSYRRYTFKRSNTPPTINDTDRDLGIKTEPFSITFSATDVENSRMDAKIYIDDVLKKTLANIGQGATQTYTLSKLDFLQLDRGRHTIRVEVTDMEGATSIRRFTFTRVIDKLEHITKIDTDAKASQVLVIPTYQLAEGAILNVLACNNANDDTPTWEDVTSKVLENKYHTFTNATKTAISWAVGIKISIEKGASTEKSYLTGYGGAYK